MKVNYYYVNGYTNIIMVINHGSYDMDTSIDFNYVGEWCDKNLDVLQYIYDKNPGYVFDNIDAFFESTENNIQLIKWLCKIYDYDRSMMRNVGWLMQNVFALNIESAIYLCDWIHEICEKGDHMPDMSGIYIVMFGKACKHSVEMCKILHENTS